MDHLIGAGHLFNLSLKIGCTYLCNRLHKYVQLMLDMILFCNVKGRPFTFQGNNLKKKMKLDIVIFGGVGDLSLRKLLPSLYYLFRQNKFPVHCRIMCVSRIEYSDTDFLSLVRSKLEEFLSEDFNEDVWEKFSQLLYYQNIDLIGEKDWHKLAHFLSISDDEEIDRNIIYYMSVAPNLFMPICKSIKLNNLNPSYSCLVVEKPLGEDLQSALLINEILTMSFQEQQIYRIDHYLGKDAVQNILHLRFSNHLMEAVWHKDHIESIEIVVAETVGVEQRAEFLDRAGTLRDMVQNHLMQLLTYIAMEAPQSLKASEIHNEKLKVINSLTPITQDNVGSRTIRAQYTAGIVNEKKVPSYQDDLKESKIKVDGTGETYVALKVTIDNDRWRGVPFVLRTGKRLRRRFAEIRISFKPPLNNLYKEANNNQLIIEIQPELTVSIEMLMKLLLGEDAQLNSYNHQMDLRNKETSNVRIPEAYEKLLLDVIKGNQAYFVRDDEIMASWRWIDGIRDAWKNTNQEMLKYSAGSSGLRFEEV